MIEADEIDWSIKKVDSKSKGQRGEKQEVNFVL